MRRFAELFHALDRSTKSSRKRQALVDYFRTAPPEDAAYAIATLCGQRPRRAVNATRLREAAALQTGLPEWLIEQTYHHVGDLAETIALLLPEPNTERELPLHEVVESVLPALARAEESEQLEQLGQLWNQLPTEQRLVFNKLLTGGFRVGVARQSVIRALAKYLDVEPERIAARLMGKITPDADLMNRLGADERPADSLAPYPFLLAHPAPQPIESLGTPETFLAEWKWDGIRAQIVVRKGQIAIWSRGEEDVTAGFPELRDAAEQLADGTVLDGEILAWGASGVRPFGDLQRRLNRKRVGAKLMADVPVRMLVYDLLQDNGEDLRNQPLSQRRERLESRCASLPDALSPSPTVSAQSWEELQSTFEQARDRGVEGLMLKQLESRYAAGRPRGYWWKWKVEPYTIDCVLLYAQAGHGRRSNLYTDYTLGVWSGDTLVPVAKAYSGLTDKELSVMDRWIRQHTTDRFGPVRAVETEQVFEIAFEGIRPSNRHKSGVALRFPRIQRWRQDKPPAEADQLSALQALLEPAADKSA